MNSFMGQGWTDSVSVAAYGCVHATGFYADALAGYAYSDNQLQRQILIPGLQPRTASGGTGANQFLGQVETGYKIGVYAPALPTLTPLAAFRSRPSLRTVSRVGRANSLNLTVAQQTTDFTAHHHRRGPRRLHWVGRQRNLDLAVRLGWMHQFADTGRPITAAFAGAPCDAFTVFGATPATQQRLPRLCRPPPPSRERPQSTCVTTARSAAETTITPSMSVRKSHGDGTANPAGHCAQAPSCPTIRALAKSKSNSLERFLASGVTHLPAEG